MVSQQHPVLRYLAVISCVLLALATVFVSAAASTHSVSWLLSFYATLAALLPAWRLRHRSELHKSFSYYLLLLLGYLLAVWQLHVNVPGAAPEKTKWTIQWVTWLLFPAVIWVAIAHFRFTRILSGFESRGLKGLEALGWIGGGVFVVLNFMGLLANDYVWAGFTWVPPLTGMYRVFFYFTTFYLLLVFAVPLAALFFKPRPERRRQILYYLVGAMPLWFANWVNFMISLGMPLYPIGGFVFLFHIAVLSYAIVFQQVFDLRFALRRGLAYAGVSALLGAAYGGMMLLIARFSGLNPLQDILAGVALITLAGLFFAPLVTQLQNVLDRVFFRAGADEQALLQTFAHKTAAASQATDIAGLLCETLSQCFSPRRVEVYLDHEIDQDNGRGISLLAAWKDGRLQLADWPLSPEVPPAFSSVLQSANASEVVEMARGETAARSVEMSESTEGLALLLRHNDQREGLVLLHPRLADEPYSEANRRLAEALCAYAATALRNAQSSAQLRFLESLTHQTFERLTAGVLLATRAGRVLRTNPTARTLIAGSPDGGAAGADSIDSVEGIAATQSELAALLRKTTQGEPLNGTVELQLSGAAPRTVLFSCRELSRAGEDWIFLAVLNDITAYKDLEKYTRKKEALARVGEMISSINHEIGNILQPTRHQVEKLMSVQSSDPVFENAMRVLPDRIAALDRMMRDLKDMSRPIELRPRTMQTESLIQSAWSDVKGLPGGERVQFTVEIEPSAASCRGDGHWLRQILVNLLKNAVEALRERPSPSLSVSARAEGSMLAIRVKDNGPGIPPETLGRLFEAFFSTKAEAGTGLGLSISRRIAELHGGNLEAASTTGCEAVFTLTLPAAKENEHSENA